MKTSKSLDENLRELIFSERKLKKGMIKLPTIDIIAVIGISIIALLIRAFLFPKQTGDYESNLLLWVEAFRESGFAAIAGDHYNYTPPYMYFLYFVSRFSITPLYAIKLLSVLFDFILAGAVGSVIFHMTEGNRKSAIMGFGAALLTPTIIANGSMWGQCDAIYVSFLTLCVLFLMKDQSRKGIICFAFAFSLKLQSIFLLPVLLVYWLYRKKMKLSLFLYIPVCYCICILPAWIGGRPLGELLTIYLGQAGRGSQLSLKYPNIFYIIGVDANVKLYYRPAILFTIALLALVFYFVVSKIEKEKFDNEMFFKLALLSLLIITNFMPFIHERYGFFCDVLMIIYGILYVKRLPIALSYLLIAFLAYTRYFNGELVIPYYFLSLIMLCIIGAVGMDFYNTVQRNAKYKISPS